MINELNWAECDVRSKHRGLHIKYPEQLDWLKDFYPDKILRLLHFIEELKEWGKQENHNDIKFLRDKVKRLKDKERTTLKEIEGRKLGHFKRKPHGTIYYLDLGAGNDGNTGLNIGQAWLTLEKYTTTTARTPGDIAYLRANTAEIPAGHIQFDEDGLREYIKIIGCDSVTNDPWGDSSDVKPIINFNGAANFAFFNFDNFWFTERVVFRNSNYIFGHVRNDYSNGNYFKTCEFIDQANAAGYGTYVFSSVVEFDSCIFKDNQNMNLVLRKSMASLKSCALDGGVSAPTNFGLVLYDDSIAEAVDTSFGQSSSHVTQDILITIYGKSQVILRNCPLDRDVLNNEVRGVVYEEDAGGVYGDYKETYYHGTVTKDTSIKTDAATFSMKMEPNANCGLCNPLTLNDDSLITFPLNILCTAGEEETVRIKIRSLGAWAAYPTADELYIEVNYLSNAASAARTTIASIQVLSHASNWVEFTVTFTPLQTGIAYGAVYLKKYEDAGDGCYVNMEKIPGTKGHIIGAKPVIMDVVTPVYTGQNIIGELEESVEMTGEIDTS